MSVIESRLKININSYEGVIVNLVNITTIRPSILAPFSHLNSMYLNHRVYDRKLYFTH